MEALFELIFGNIAFIIVVIGGIISFLKRASQGEEQTKQKKSFKPHLDWPEIEIDQPKVETHLPKQSRPKVAREIQPTQYIEVELPANPFNEKLKKMESDSQHINRSTNSFPRKIDSIQTSPEIDINVRDINQKKVIEGIVWGEILGPPRAKKKHMYSYMKRS